MTPYTAQLALLVFFVSGFIYRFARIVFRINCKTEDGKISWKKNEILNLSHHLILFFLLWGTGCFASIGFLDTCYFIFVFVSCIGNISNMRKNGIISFTKPINSDFKFSLSVIGLIGAFFPHILFLYFMGAFSLILPW